MSITFGHQTKYLLNFSINQFNSLTDKFSCWKLINGKKTLFFAILSTVDVFSNISSVFVRFPVILLVRMENNVDKIALATFQIQHIFQLKHNFNSQ